ncbi:mitochondrial ribonuclease P catalytic subunit isoform X2 [Plectropomus leopardus]|uniref:mitochondrial ribonuclease P catalytic subunit isoform X2 n=1 Tax=Plectropomus leopardus TaxID=160734 RepID=UPI001C4D0CAF|nr:mitochondrial ribonuclease P catalytic subunit isoform X2 [Plectropomus leopardus]
MGSTLILKSSQLPPSARFLCTRDNNPYPGDGQTSKRSSGWTQGHGGVKNSTIRRRTEEYLRDSVEVSDKSSTAWRRSPVSKSVFAAGTAKRMTEMLKRKSALVSLDDQEDPEERATSRAVKLQPPEQPLSVTEWMKLKESLGNPQYFDRQMMTVLIKAMAELDIAKSLLTFVAVEKGTLSYELLLRYLTLCVMGGHDSEVVDVYDIMLGTFSSLDPGACSLFIKSFSRTERWRKALGVLQELKKVFTPSSRNYGDIISGAMLNGERSTAWALYDELIEKGLSPHQDTWEALFKAERKTEEEKRTETVSQSEHEERLQAILLYMRNNNIYPQQRLANCIKTWFESLEGQKWTGKWTRATLKGVCKCCGSELESIWLTDEEYQQLKDRVMTDIIQGQDVFKKTTPEELERFKAFVERRPAFDVVIDGLNVANITKNKHMQSEMLLAVVSELVGQGLTVLVLGRKHMLRPSKNWGRDHMNLIKQKAHCFFTDNISEDDPFLLYASLNSGKHCQFVSRDLMRDHKACLPDDATRRLFFKWQRGHQVVVHGLSLASRRVKFQSILSFDTIIQTSADSWHIPYDDTEDRSSHEVPQRWLCLSKKH